MGTIDDGVITHQVIWTEGDIPLAKPLVRAYEVAGAPGTGHIVGPVKRAPFAMTSHSTVANQAGALLLQELFEVLVGAPVDLVDEVGRSAAGVMVLDCTAVPRPLLAQAGGNDPADTWEVVTVWLFQAPV